MNLWIPMKRSSTSIPALLATSFLVFTITFSYSQKYEKKLVKIDESYTEGDYLKGQKNLEKFRKKVNKKLGANNKYMVDYYLRQARFNIATGILVGLDQILENALTVSASVNGEDSKAHALNQLEVADIWVFYGNYINAKKHVDDAEATLKATNEIDDGAKAQIELKKAQILSGQGFYNEALKFINQNLNYFQGRAVTEVSYVDEKGKLKTRRLDEREVTDRLSDYATLLTLKAKTFAKKGKYLSADSAFARTKQWIDDSDLGDKSIDYANNQYLYGKFLVENGLKEFNRATKDEDFDKTLTALKKKHEESHYMAFNLYEALLKYYLYQDQKAKYRNAKIEYEKAIKRNFKRSSLHYINLETMEFDSKLLKDRTSNVSKDANKILGTTKALPLHHPKTLELVDVLYRLSVQEKNYSNAEAYLKQQLDIKQGLYGGNSVEYHLTKVELANFYVNYSDKIEEANKIYKESFYGVVEPQLDTWHKDYINILNHLATYYQITDQYGKATETLGLALRTARAKFDPKDPNYGTELNELAKLQVKIGNYDQANNYITEAVQILEEQKRNEKRVVDYVNALETQAKLKSILGYFDEAEDNLHQAQRFLRRAESTAAYNELESNQELASLYTRLGDYRETEELLNELIKNYETRYGVNSRKLIDPLVSKGHLLLISGEYALAENTATRANRIATEVFEGNSTKIAPALTLLSELYTSLGDYEKAEQHATAAVNIYKDRFGPDHIDVGKTTAQLGLIKFYDGSDLKEVEQLMESAKEIIADKLGNRNPTYAELLVDISKVYIAQNRFDDAFNSLGLAESIWEQKVGRRNNINTASIYLLEGDIYYMQRNFDKAEEKYEKAKKLYEKFFNRNHPEYVKTLSKLSKVYYMDGDSKKSKRFIEEALANYQNYIREFFPALTEREKAKYWNTIRPDYEFYNTLAFQLSKEDKSMPGHVYNNALLTKAILLNSSLKIRARIMNSNDQELKDKYNEWLDKKEQLTSVLSMSIEELIQNEIDPNTLTAEVEGLEKEISQKSEDFSQATENNNVVWEDVQNVLKPNEVAIEMVRYRHFDHVFTDSVIYAAIYIKNKDQQEMPQAALITDGENMEDKYFKNYRNSIIYQIPDRYSYEAYWEPLKEVVGNYATIYLSADGVYNQINLETIPTEDGKNVIDKANIILVSNTKDLYFNSIRPHLVQNDQVASVFGNPNFYLTASITGDISPLPGTEKEVRELHDLLSGQGWNIDTYTEIEAKEEQVKELNSPKVFHIATHGFFTPADEHKVSDQIALSESQAAQNPLLRTGLLLAGAGDVLSKTTYNYNLESGILTAYEAMNLNLDQTDLVVLSACETGRGELAIGEGVYGLQRAFIVAGAKTLIMSMFKVNDEATQKLMVKFYKRWLETGNKRKAFVDAKKEIRTEYHDPIYWGSFIMIGLD